MIEVKFTGSDISVLKDEIREFAIAHLGINFEKMAQATFGGALAGNPPPSNPVGGSVGPAPGEVIKKRPGRPPRAPESTPVPVAASAPIATIVMPPAVTVAPTPQPSAATPPTQEQVNDSIRALVAKDNNNLNRAREFLARFKVSKGKDLKEDQRADFIALIQSVL